MIGVPVPSMRICERPAGGDGGGDDCASSTDAEIKPTMTAAALTTRVLRNGECDNEERRMLVPRVGGRQTLPKTGLQCKRGTQLRFRCGDLRWDLQNAAPFCVAQQCNSFSHSDL